jgi:hypothetical protein
MDFMRSVARAARRRQMMDSSRELARRNFGESARDRPHAPMARHFCMAGSELR